MAQVVQPPSNSTSNNTSTSQPPSQSYRDREPSTSSATSAPRSFYSTYGSGSSSQTSVQTAQGQKTSPPHPPFSEDEEEEDDPRDAVIEERGRARLSNASATARLIDNDSDDDVNIGNPSPIHTQSAAQSQFFQQYPNSNSIYPKKPSSNGSATTTRDRERSQPQPSIYNSAARNASSDLLLDFHVPPLPDSSIGGSDDVGGELDFSSSPSSVTPPAGVPAPAPALNTSTSRDNRTLGHNAGHVNPIFNHPSNNHPPAPQPSSQSREQREYAAAGPRRQFLVQQSGAAAGGAGLARPGSPLRHDATAALFRRNSAGSNGSVGSTANTNANTSGAGTVVGTEHDRDRETVVLPQGQGGSSPRTSVSKPGSNANINVNTNVTAKGLPAAVSTTRGRLPTPPKNANAHPQQPPMTTSSSPSSPPIGTTKQQQHYSPSYVNSNAIPIPPPKERDLLGDEFDMEPPPNAANMARTSPPTNTNSAGRKPIGGPRASSGNVPVVEGRGGGSNGSTPTKPGSGGANHPDRSLPLREDDFGQRGGFNNNRNDTSAVSTSSRTPSPSHTQSQPPPPQPQTYNDPPRPQSQSPVQSYGHSRRRSNAQYSPELTANAFPQLHAPRAMPLLDLDFEQAYLARAASALGGNVGMPYYFPYPPPASRGLGLGPGTPVGAGGAGGYYQPPLYGDYEYLYYQGLGPGEEEEEEEEEDGHAGGAANIGEAPMAAGNGRGRGTSPTPSSTLMHGLSLPEDEATAQEQMQNSYYLQQQQQQQHRQAGSSTFAAQQQQPAAPTPAPASRPHGRRRSDSFPSLGSTLPAYEDYYGYSNTPAQAPPAQLPSQQSNNSRPAFNRDDTITQDRARPQPVHSQTQGSIFHQQHQEQREEQSASLRNPPVDEIPPYGGNRQSQQQQSKKEPLTRANVRLNANVAGPMDGYDPVELQHAMWLLEVC